jgi:PIN domain nuclease of toxin-antitoxin system
MLRAVADTHAVVWYLYDDRAVAAAMPRIDREQIPDLPDRIISATAERYDVPAISRDRRIRLAGLPTIW